MIGKLKGIVDSISTDGAIIDVQGWAMWFLPLRAFLCTCPAWAKR